MSGPLNLSLEVIEDKYIRTNFQRLEDYINNNPLLQMCIQCRQFKVTSAGKHKIPHGLRYAPNVIMMASVFPSSGVTIHYDETTDKVVCITTTEPVNINLLVGRK